MKKNIETSAKESLVLCELK